MDDNDNDLRAAFLHTFKSGVPTDACPTPERLFDAYHQLLPLEERERMVDHVAGCSVCADAWRLAGRTSPPAPERE